MTAEPMTAVDTSVAVPLLVASHRQHSAVSTWATGRTLHLSGHALPETYAVLTRLPGDARVAATDAITLIDESFAAPLTASAQLARQAHRELAQRDVVGGATYDGLVGLVAREHGAVLATRDARARSTYEAIGITVELLAAADVSP